MKRNMRIKKEIRAFIKIFEGERHSYFSPRSGFEREKMLPFYFTYKDTQTIEEVVSILKNLFQEEE